MPRKHTARGRKQLSRRSQHPTRVATANNSIVSRQFRYTTQIALDTVNNTQGGVVNFFGFNNAIGDYVGSDYITNNHEQYRVKRIKLMARPSTGLFPQTSEDASIATVVDILQFQIAQYNLCNLMEVQSFVDYDTGDAPASYDEILSRPNTKIQCLPPNKWTMVANFVPKTLQEPGLVTSPEVVFSSNTWLSSSALTPLLYGVRGRFSLRFNENPSFLNRIGIDIFAIATVEMRGVRNNTCSDSLSVPRPFGFQPAAIPHVEERDGELKETQSL